MSDAHICGLAFVGGWALLKFTDKTETYRRLDGPPNKLLRGYAQIWNRGQDEQAMENARSIPNRAVAFAEPATITIHDADPKTYAFTTGAVPFAWMTLGKHKKASTRPKR